jgi:RNA polymerase sigma-70 factor (ECF subfamily)
MPSEPIGHYQTDAELFLLLKNGQTNALAILYDRHCALVYGIALQLLGNTEEAEDLTQNIFLKLIDNSSYDPKRGSLRTFLAMLTRSRSIDRLRARTRANKNRSRQISNERDRVLYDSNNSIERISQTERSTEVQNALDRLSSQEREVLQMAYYEGLSQSEIATRLDTPIGTIKSRARRGLLKLREALTNLREES